jgi:predicted lipid-binding transport protein (Tim44 family)
VVVGSLRPVRAFESGTTLCIEYFFETNLHIEVDAKAAAPTGGVSTFLVNAGLATVSPDKKGALTQYVQESWTFSRELAVKTRPWTGVRKLGCPNCGAPLDTGGDVRCPSCGEASGGGRFDWQVIGVTVTSVEAREHSLTGSTVEAGTDAATRFDSLLGPRLQALFQADQGLNAESIEARLRLIFTTLQPAWSAQDLRPLRPFVSDRQYDYLQYWIDAYREQGLKNLMEGPRLERFVFVRVERDAHYDALTLRIWATGCDYTVETKSGRVVGGSRTSERRYSEYWTLIRSAKARGTPHIDQNCPGCGASLQVNMGGECAHCGAHMTSGEFNWVLSRIEQDEAYAG